MKKYFTVTLLLIAFVVPSKAQFKFGVQAGLNLSSVSTKDYADDVESQTGFFAGPTVKYTLPVIGIGFDAAIVYDHREGLSKWGTVKAQSVQIPINIRYGFGVSSIAEVFAFAGPQFGVVVEDGYDFDLSRSFSLNSSNYSANIGIGTTLLSHIQAKFNYNIALSETGTFEMRKGSTFGSVKINTWQVSLAYFF